jgi:hypothetical protein
MQVLRSVTVWEVAGSVTPEQSEFGTVVPSERRQVPVRVSVAVVEHVLLGALHALICQL